MCCELMRAELSWLESRAGRLGAQNTELPRPPVGERGSSLELHKICQKGGVHNVHTFVFELGRTSAGLGRIGYVFWSSQCFQGLECSSSPTLGTA